MDANEIIQLLALFMFEQRLIEISEKLSRRDDSLWAKISVFVFGVFDYVRAALVYYRWKRNSNGFKDKVLGRLKNLKDNSSMDIDCPLFVSTIVLNVPFDKWIELQSANYLTTYDDGRERFNSNFSYFLNTALKKDFQFKCWLSCVYNWKSASSGKNYWTGTFKCIGVLCSIKYKAFIKRDPKGSQGVVPITFVWRGNVDHSDMARPKRCCGAEREAIGTELLAFGLPQVQANHIIENAKQGDQSELSIAHMCSQLTARVFIYLSRFQGKPTDTPRLSKIKGSKLRAKKIDKDLIIDTSATKHIYLSNTSKYDDSIRTSIKGFIQTISYDPFGVLFLSSLQVCST